MSDIFIMKGMDRLGFPISESTSAPYSFIFGLITARAAILSAADRGSILIGPDSDVDEAMLRSAASRLHEEYLFDAVARERVLNVVQAYLNEFPDERVCEMFDFAVRPESAPQHQSVLIHSTDA